MLKFTIFEGKVHSYMWQRPKGRLLAINEFVVKFRLVCLLIISRAIRCIKKTIIATTSSMLWLTQVLFPCWCCVKIQNSYIYPLYAPLRTIKLAVLNNMFTMGSNSENDHTKAKILSLRVCCNSKSVLQKRAIDNTNTEKMQQN